MELAICKASAKKAEDRGYILRVAAVTVKAVRHKPFVRAVGVLDAEIEIAVNREAEATHAQARPMAKRKASPLSGQWAVRRL